MCIPVLSALFLSILFAPSVSKATLVNSNSFVVDDIEYYIQTNKFVYDLGEDVEALFRVTNLSDETVSIGTSYPIMDIIVSEEEGGSFNEIWNWSWDKGFHTGPVLFELEPDESIELDDIWPQINLNGSVEIEDHTPVPPGIFRVAGYLHPTDTTISVNISIVPEPSSLALFITGICVVVHFHKKRKD